MEEDLITTNLWPELITQKNNKFVVDIELSTVSEKPTQYIVQLGHQLLPHIAEKLTLLFPTHPDEEKRILYCQHYKHYHQLGHEINQRVNNSLNAVENVKMAFIYENLIYRCRNIVGTVYLLWSQRLNVETRASQQNTIAEQIPCIIEMSGNMEIRNIVFVHETTVVHEYGRKRIYPIDRKQINLIIPNQVVLFPCEVDTRKDIKHNIKTLSKQQADNLTKNPVVRRFVEGIKAEEIPFQSETDSEDTQYVRESDDEMYDIKLQEMTPRVQLNIETNLLEPDEQLNSL